MTSEPKKWRCSMSSEEYDAYVEALAAKAPPLSAEKKDKLWILLTPAREHLARKYGKRGDAA
jgi:hypothetical protein